MGREYQRRANGQFCISFSGLWTLLAGFSKQTHSEPALITGCFAKPTCLSKNGLEGKEKDSKRWSIL